jgi:hypothetical protein
VQQIVEMGFSQAQAEEALRRVRVQQPVLTSLLPFVVAAGVEELLLCCHVNAHLYTVLAG